MEIKGEGEKNYQAGESIVFNYGDVRSGAATCLIVILMLWSLCMDFQEQARQTALTAKIQELTIYIEEHDDQAKEIRDHLRR